MVYRIEALITKGPTSVSNVHVLRSGVYCSIIAGVRRKSLFNQQRVDRPCRVRLGLRRRVFSSQSQIAAKTYAILRFADNAI